MTIWRLPGDKIGLVMRMTNDPLIIPSAKCQRGDIFIAILDGLPGFAGISKRKTNQEFLKYVTRQGFEPATSCVAGG